MKEKKWANFKSGSDIRGFGISSDCAENTLYLSDTVISQIINGFALWLNKRTNENLNKMSVSVGHDSRLSAQRIKGNVISVLNGLGIRVLDCGLSSTPAMFMTTVDLDCLGAIQITASHHPYDRNGFKFFTRDGGLDGKDIDKILMFAQNNLFASSGIIGSVERVHYMDIYAAHLRSMICSEIQAADYDKPLTGYKIVVDAGNGVGGFYAINVLEPLGADISGSLYLDPDGSFPNHAPNPEDEEAMKAISTAVIDVNADFGIIFDTDVDRAACVSKGGGTINRNRLIALAAAVTLEKNAGAVIVTDSITSDGLTAFIEDCGGRHFRYKRGYKNVIDKQMELTRDGVNCPLAIETSGHASFSENYFLDDGAYLITKLIIKMALLGRQNKSLEDLIANLKEPLEENEVRFKIAAEDFRTYGETVIQKVQEHAAQQEGWHAVEDNYEGVRVSTDSNNGCGWFLLRLSVHDPVMALNAESDVSGGIKLMFTVLREVLKDFEKLNISDLNTAIDE
ncbi:MAG TPA: phosphomannomutase/phosphoglucomutase [Clostridia bacterium]|nr:phosphomannomutase/phosphoglucomutase [Clostridia bacterium]